MPVLLLRAHRRKAVDAWITNWTFKHMLVKRAYTRERVAQMVQESQFGTCTINVDQIGLEVRLSKPR